MSCNNILEYLIIINNKLYFLKNHIISFNNLCKKHHKLSKKTHLKKSHNLI